MAKRMNILSIDPSTTCCGWALFTTDAKWRGEKLSDWGNIKPPAKISIIDKRDMLNEHFVQMISDCMIDYVFIEKAARDYKPQFHKSVRILQDTIALLHDAIMNQLSPGQVFGSCAQTWKGSEKKHRTLSSCNLLYNLDLKQKDNDIADAIMAGTFFIERMRVHPLEPFHLCTC